MNTTLLFDDASHYDKQKTSGSEVQDDPYFFDGEGDDLLYGTLSCVAHDPVRPWSHVPGRRYDDHARATFEMEARRDRAHTMTFTGALWRLGAFSIFLSVIIELGAVWIRRAKRGTLNIWSVDDDLTR